MAPRTNQVAASGGRRQPQQPGAIASIYGELRSPENAALVKSIAIFGLTVAFFQSSWSEYLVPTF